MYCGLRTGGSLSGEVGGGERMEIVLWVEDRGFFEWGGGGRGWMEIVLWVEDRGFFEWGGGGQDGNCFVG